MYIALSEGPHVLWRPHLDLGSSVHPPNRKVGGQ